MSSVTILARLLNADPVREKLGTSLELPPSSDSSSFRAHVRDFTRPWPWCADCRHLEAGTIPIVVQWLSLQYRSSALVLVILNNYAKPSISFGHLSKSLYIRTYLQILTMVGRVEIHGRFPVLSSGIILVDLPGSGDDDET